MDFQKVLLMKLQLIRGEQDVERPFVIAAGSVSLDPSIRSTLSRVHSRFGHLLFLSEV